MIVPRDAGMYFSSSSLALVHDKDPVTHTVPTTTTRTTTKHDQLLL